MKTVIFKISGVPVEGDVAELSYTTPKGGVSHALYRVKGERARAELNGQGEAIKIVEPADTAAVIASKLAEAINDTKSEYCAGQFTARASDNMLVVSCSDSVEDVIFLPQFCGSGTGEIKEV